MASTGTTSNSAPTTTGLTQEAFLADRMGFWHSFTGFTAKSTVSLILFCAWLWWCSFTSFSLLHVLVLPVVVAAVVFAL